MSEAYIWLWNQLRNSQGPIQKFLNGGVQYYPKDDTEFLKDKGKSREWMHSFLDPELNLSRGTRYTLSLTMLLFMSI